jgi:hypothetical protein
MPIWFSRAANMVKRQAVGPRQSLAKRIERFRARERALSFQGGKDGELRVKDRGLQEVNALRELQNRVSVANDMVRWLAQEATDGSGNVEVRSSAPIFSDTISIR